MGGNYLAEYLINIVDIVRISDGILYFVSIATLMRNDGD